jgi:hypothetical protein
MTLFVVIYVIALLLVIGGFASFLVWLNYRNIKDRQTDNIIFTWWDQCPDYLEGEHGFCMVYKCAQRDKNITAFDVMQCYGFLEVPLPDALIPFALENIDRIRQGRFMISGKLVFIKEK